MNNNEKRHTKLKMNLVRRVQCAALLLFFVLLHAMSTQAQTASVYAGTTGVAGFGGDGGPAIAAKLNNNWGLAIDHALGRLYIVDFGNARLRWVDMSTGNINTYAGTGVAGYNGENIPAATARLNGVTGVAVDGSGNVFISEVYNARARKINIALPHNINTVAGNGTSGYTGDGGPGPLARIGAANGITTDAAGTVYLPAYGTEVLRKVIPAGTISTIAGPGYGYAGDGLPIGPVTKFRLINDVKHDWATGDIYVSDWTNNIIRKITPAGNVIDKYAGTAGATGYTDNVMATAALLRGPMSFDVDCDGNLYFCDVDNHVVRKVTKATGIINTISGIPTTAGSGSVQKIQYNRPRGLALDAIGDVYVSDQFNARVVKLTFDASVCAGNTIALCDKSGIGTWSSSDVSVATVDASGVVTGVTPGMATITLTIGSYFLTKKVTVGPPAPITGPTTVAVGSAITLSDATAGGVWSSSGANATVNGVTGEVTGTSAGVEVITYTIPGGCFQTYTVTVTDVKRNCIDKSDLKITSTLDPNGNCVFTATASVGTGYMVMGYEWTLPSGVVVVHTSAPTDVQTFTLPMGGSFVVSVRIHVVRNDWQAGESPCCETYMEQRISCEKDPGNPCDTMQPPVITASTMLNPDGVCVPVFSSSVYPATINFMASISSTTPAWSCGPFIGSATLTSPGPNIISPCDISSADWDASMCTPPTPYPCPLGPGSSVHITWAMATMVSYMGCEFRIQVPIEVNCDPAERAANNNNAQSSDLKAVTQLSVAPNPTDGALTLSGAIGNISAKEVKIVVTDMLGKTILSDKCPVSNGSIHKKVVLGNNVSNGTYVIKVSGDDVFQTIRFNLSR